MSMADINETDFYKGALWAADILLTTSHFDGANEEVRDILEHIPNLYSIVMRTPETKSMICVYMQTKNFHSA